MFYLEYLAVLENGDNVKPYFNIKIVFGHIMVCPHHQQFYLFFGNRICYAYDLVVASGTYLNNRQNIILLCDNIYFRLQIPIVLVFDPIAFFDQKISGDFLPFLSKFIVFSHKISKYHTKIVHFIEKIRC